MNKKCKGAASNFSVNGLPAIEEDDVFVEKGPSKDKKKMKLFSSKRKTSLFIPGISFRKNKKLFRYNREKELSEIGPLSEDSLLVRPCDGDNASIKSSVSSLEEQLSDQRTDSVDSGIDCLHPAFRSDASLPYGRRIPASPLSSTASLPSPSKLDLSGDLPSNSKMQKHCSHSNVGEKSKGKGRAPIASPEDDSLLDNPEEDSDCDSDSDSDLRSPPRKCDSDSDSDLRSPPPKAVPMKTSTSPSAHNSSASSFHTLSDCSSCDSDSDTYTDSDSHSSYSSDGPSPCMNRSPESDSDSDSDTSQCSGYYVPPKCYLDYSSSKSVSASRSGQIPLNRGSQLPSNSVHTNCVNTSKAAAKPEKQRKARIEKAPLSFLRKRKKKSSKDSKKADKSIYKSDIGERLFNFNTTEIKLFNSTMEDRSCNKSKSCDKLFNSSDIFHTSQTEDKPVHSRSLNSSSRSLNSSSRSMNSSSRSMNSSSRSLNSSSRSVNGSSRLLNSSSQSVNSSSRLLNSSSQSVNSSSQSMNSRSRSLNSSSHSLNSSSRSLNSTSRSMNSNNRSMNSSSRSLNSSSRSLNSSRLMNDSHWSLNNSSLSNVKQPVNSTSQDVKSKRSSRNVNRRGNSVVMEDPHILVNPSPQYSHQTDHSITVTPIRESHSTSNLSVNSRSAFSRCNTTGSLPRQRISYVDGDSCRFTSEEISRSALDEPIYHEIDDINVRDGASDRYVNVRTTNNPNMSSFGYVQMCAVKNARPATPDPEQALGNSEERSQNEYCEMADHIPRNEYSEVTDVLDSSDCDPLPLDSCDQCDKEEASPNMPFDTSKSIVDVRRAMRKTAFWVENATYDSTCGSEDGSPSSLLKDKKSVSEMDLCNQIIDIYFGDDSDSSLSSSCLENSFDQDSSLSFGTDENASPDEFPSPPTNETNVDHDYPVATFVSEPYQTFQAKTRKIRNGDSETAHVQLDQKVYKSRSDTHSKKHHRQSERRSEGKSVLKEKCENINTPKKPEKKSSRATSVSRVFCDSRPPSLLSEQEVDTITKLHTICNSQRKVSYLDISKAEMVIKHYPPPKHASRISWSDQLTNDDLNHHTPTTSPAKRSILHQRPQSFIFPYVEDEPSPIVITRVRRSKSSSRRKEWPW
ncbi:dentin sialophosphoprotein-like isoform X2 [Argopecten irradians]|uniref:dentin sialophosphoprotein-like isoform X2 n=1 Tax=Argopecten irradians TaxID=31199 RepID=UPI00371F95A6